VRIPHGDAVFVFSQRHGHHKEKTIIPEPLALLCDLCASVRDLVAGNSSKGTVHRAPTARMFWSYKKQAKNLQKQTDWSRGSAVDAEKSLSAWSD